MQRGGLTDALASDVAVPARHRYAYLVEPGLCRARSGAEPPAQPLQKRAATGLRGRKNSVRNSDRTTCATGRCGGRPLAGGVMVSVYGPAKRKMFASSCTQTA